MNEPPMLEWIIVQSVDEFFRTHPAMAILLASGAIFYGGYQYLGKGKKQGAFLWMLWAAVMSFAFSIGALACKMWVAALTSLVLFVVQVLLMKRWFEDKGL